MITLPGFGMEPYQLDEHQVKFFDSAGYLIVESLFSKAECDTILELSLKYVDKNYSPVLNLDREVEELRSVMRAPRIVSILRKLQGSEVVGLQSQLIIKDPKSIYASQAWHPHQDSTYVKNTERTYQNVHIALSDQDVENGCLYLFSGSHKEGQYPYEPTMGHQHLPGENPGNRVDDEILKKYKKNKINLIVKKGDLIFMDGNTIHGSYPNLSKTRSRPTLTLCYINKGASFFVGKNAKRMEIPL